MPPGETPPQRPETLTDRVYTQVKQDIFEFRMLPGDSFTESEIAARTGASRTPVREALYRLQQDGFVEVKFRNGWQVKPLDFAVFDELYDLRIILELAAIDKLCVGKEPPNLEDLNHIWLVPKEQRSSDGPTVAGLDKRFHEQLVEATGNCEMARIHHEITERIHIIRRLDFTKPDRVTATYDEHQEILHHLARNEREHVRILLASHIEASKSAVRQITLHMLHDARQIRPDPNQS